MYYLNKMPSTFPYMNNLSFIGNQEIQSLLNVAMRVANENNLYDFIRTNRYEYYTEDELKHVLHIKNALESECNWLVTNIDKWCKFINDRTELYYVIIKMLECISRDGFDSFSQDFYISKYLPQFSTGLSEPTYRLFETVSIPYLSTRGQIVKNAVNNKYIIQLLNGTKIYAHKDEIRPFDVRKIDLPVDADFTFISDINIRNMVKSGYRSIMRTESWNIIREFKDESFMFNDNPSIRNIINTVSEDFDGAHSGYSIGITMRILERISHLGFKPLKN